LESMPILVESNLLMVDVVLRIRRNTSLTFIDMKRALSACHQEMQNFFTSQKCLREV
jgi:hypothetical protein